jgi:NAD(P)-dependent dehydrogenase (short-subunit alcohol dehydrogenase family)
MTRSTMELFDLTGQTAVISGGGGLLGPVFAKALLDAGASVFLLDANEEGLKKSVEHLSEAKPVHLDITNENMVEKSINKISDVSILINAAAVNPKFEPDETGQIKNAGAFSSYSLENWQRSLDVNLTGTFLVTRAVCKSMEKRGSGSIVNVASHYGMRGPDQRIYKDKNGNQTFFKPIDYSVTKAGIFGFTRALAAYYRDTSIRVNSLSPGGAFNNHDDHFTEQYSARTILGRMAEPDEYRGAILFLCSDASSYMTGANLVVDGGWTAL